MTTPTIIANGFTGFLGRGAAQRELECILEVAAGRSSKEAAKKLGCSPSTIEKAIERLFYKLGVCNRAALVAAAFQRGIIAFACGAPTPGPQHHEDSDDHQGIFIA